MHLFDAAWLDYVQWPAMAIAVYAAWLVGAQRPKLRKWGFWCFLTGNALWVVWGLHDAAWALIVLQIGLATINVRNVRRNDRAQHAEEGGEA